MGKKSKASTLDIQGLNSGGCVKIQDSGDIQILVYL